MTGAERESQVCRASTDYPGVTMDLLCCWLLVGHKGPHYDEQDDMSWEITVKKGVPEVHR